MIRSVEYLDLALPYYTRRLAETSVVRWCYRSVRFLTYIKYVLRLLIFLLNNENNFNLFNQQILQLLFEDSITECNVFESISSMHMHYIDRYALKDDTSIGAYIQTTILHAESTILFLLSAKIKYIINKHIKPISLYDSILSYYINLKYTNEYNFNHNMKKLIPIDMFNKIVQLHINKNNRYRIQCCSWPLTENAESILYDTNTILCDSVINSFDIEYILSCDRMNNSSERIKHFKLLIIRLYQSSYVNCSNNLALNDIEYISEHIQTRQIIYFNAITTSQNAGLGLLSNTNPRLFNEAIADRYIHFVSENRHKARYNYNLIMNDLSVIYNQNN